MSQGNGCEGIQTDTAETTCGTVLQRGLVKVAAFTALGVSLLTNSGCGPVEPAVAWPGGDPKIESTTEATPDVTDEASPEPSPEASPTRTNHEQAEVMDKEEIITRLGRISLYQHPGYFAGCVVDGGRIGFTTVSGAQGNVCRIPGAEQWIDGDHSVYTPHKEDIDLLILPDVGGITACENAAETTGREYSAYHKQDDVCVVASVNVQPL